MALYRMFLGLVLCLLALPAVAHDTKVGELVIMQPWARATIGQGKTGAAYVTIVNHGTATDRLLSVSTPAAAKAALHTHTVVDGVMKMRPVEAIEIEAKAATALEPGGNHVMLMGLEAPLTEGDAFPLTLTFEAAGTVEVEVRVQGVAASHSEKEESHAGHGDGHGDHDHGAHHHGAHHHGKPISLPGGPSAPTLEIVISEDSVDGWNLHVRTTNFRFSPEHVNGAHRDGEGHAHLYVNGKKLSRIYGPWFHIGSLQSGLNEVTVTLNANDHRHLEVEGESLSVTETVHVP